MKRLKFNWLWTLLALAGALFSACDDDNTEPADVQPLPPTITLTGVPETGMEFIYFADQPRTFTMAVDAKWEITKNSGWFVVTPLKGNADDRILITVTPEANGGGRREGSFTIKANSGTFLHPIYTEAEVKVVQDAFLAAGLQITGLESKDIVFDVEQPEPVKFTVTGTYDWTIEATDKSWITISPESGAAGTTVEVTLTAQPNTAPEAHSSTLTVKCGDSANPANSVQEVLELSQKAYFPTDKHETGYVFFEDDFNWITPLWNLEKYNQPYGWPTVDNSDFHFIVDGANSPVGAKAEEMGYTFNASVYGRYLGFVKLGKTNENGILTTRKLSGIDAERTATLLVQFDGAYYKTASGTVDNGTAMSITVVGGGTIDSPDATDEGRTLSIPMLNAFAWDRYSIIVKDAGADTQIQFCDGKAEKNIKTRLFLDNVKVTRADDENPQAPATEAVVLPLDAAIAPSGDAEVDAAAQKVNYTVRVNRAWTASSDSDWLTFSKVGSGNSNGAQGSKVSEDKKSVTVVASGLVYNVALSIAENTAAAARTGRIVLSVDGKAIGSLTVKQAGANLSEPKITIEGLAGNEINFDCDATEAQTFTVNANCDWTIETADTWYTAAPAKGAANETVTVSVTPTANSGEARSGKFTIKASTEAVEITVSQAEYTDPNLFSGLPARWQFSEADMSKYQEAFEKYNAAPSEIGNGILSYTHTYSDPNHEKIARIVGGTGHPYITGGWPGDYWLFSVPVKNLKAGTKVRFSGLTRTSATGHKYWTLEYFDGEWKPATTVITETVEGLGEVSYTHAMNADGKTNLNISVVVTFANDIPDGEVQFRFRCMANWQASGKGALKAPNGGTCRWAGTANGDSPAIEVVE